MIKQFIADAFTDKIFHGNPAAICLPERWPDDKLMQDIASENNLSETAFVVKEDSGWKLRWFTPGGEIDLCGHATLATAFVLMNFVEPDLTEVQFSTLSGKLSVKKKNDLYEMDFPAYELKRIEVTEAMEKAIGCKPLEAWIGRDLVCVLENEDQVIQAKPDLEKAKALDGLLLRKRQVRLREQDVCTEISRRRRSGMRIRPLPLSAAMVGKAWRERDIGLPDFFSRRRPLLRA